MTRLAAVLWVLPLLAGCPPKQPKPIEPAAQPAPGTPSETPEPGEPGAAPSLTPADARAPVQDRVDEASALIEKGGPAELDRAIALLNSAVADDRTGVVRFDLGLAYKLRGNLREAQSQFQTVIAADPANGDAWLCLGHVHELDGDDRAALSTYETGISNVPEHLGLRVALIGALRKAGRVDEAIAQAQDALKINTKAIEVYNALGLAYLDKRNLVLAKFVFQKAEQEIPGAKENAVLQTNIGWTFYLDDNEPEATTRLQKALTVDPNLVPALVYLSHIYMDDHNYVDTVPLLENAARRDPNNASVQLNLGLAYRGVGRLDDAERAYKKALELDPADPSPHFNLGVLLGDYRKNYDSAINAFNTYIAANGPESALAQGYIKDLQKEKEIAEKRAKAEIEKKAREEERKRKEQLAKEQELKEAQTPAPAPDAPDAPAPEPAPTPDGGAPPPEVP